MYEIAEISHIEGGVFGHVIIDRTSHHIYRPWIGSDRCLFGSAAVAEGVARYMERHSPYHAPLDHYLLQHLFERLPDAAAMGAMLDYDEDRIAEVVVGHMERMAGGLGQIATSGVITGVSWGVILGSALFTIRLDLADGRRLLAVGHILPQIDRRQDLSPDWDGLHKLRGERVSLTIDPRAPERLFITEDVPGGQLLISLYVHAVTMDEIDLRMCYQLDGQVVTLCTTHAIREAEEGEHHTFYPLPDHTPAAGCATCEAERLEDMAADHQGGPTATEVGNRYAHTDARYEV